jgi:hypothetical protein
MEKQLEQQIRGEILQLLHEQMDALDEGTFVGIQEDKLREYDKRAERIRNLAEKVSAQSESDLR